MSEADEAANKVADQLGKAKSEIDGVISDLENQSVQPGTLDRLKGLSQALDDVVPDAPTPEPTPEPSPGDVQPDPAPPADEG